MFIGRLRALRERGDTIVEVMIAVAVISMVLGGAFVTTNRNVQTSRNTEEQSSGLKLAESQVEQIKGIVAVDPSKVFDSPYASFCVFENELYESGSDNCAVDSKGGQTGAQPQYRLAATRSDNTFTIQVRWDRLGGNQGNVRMIYRIHE